MMAARARLTSVVSPLPTFFSLRQLEIPALRIRKTVAPAKLATFQKLMVRLGTSITEAARASQTIQTKRLAAQKEIREGRAPMVRMKPAKKIPDESVRAPPKLVAALRSLYSDTPIPMARSGPRGKDFARWAFALEEIRKTINELNSL